MGKGCFIRMGAEVHGMGLPMAVYIWRDVGGDFYIIIKKIIYTL